MDRGAPDEGSVDVVHRKWAGPMSAGRGRDHGPPWTEETLLTALVQAGAPGLRRIRFRSNRSTIWSVTAGGSALNLHEGYRAAPWSCVRHFATLVAGATGGGEASAAPMRRAMEVLRAWPGLGPAVELARRRHRSRTRTGSRTMRPGPCCATPEQRASLRRLYLRLNRSGFGNVLPPDLHIRLSSRMRSRLGHMKGHVHEGRRYVVEIALSARLMHEGNRAQRVDTLLHEMAHAADWLLDGGRGHGPTWKAWARRGGCEAKACTRAPIIGEPPTSRGSPLPWRPTPPP